MGRWPRPKARSQSQRAGGAAAPDRAADALTSLNLRGCPLKELPPQIGQLTALTQLWLQGCLLRKLPPQIGQLTVLTYLDLTSCPLKELPPQIGQLKALAMLNLENCLLKELPPEFGQLQALSILFLDGCEQLTLTPGAEQYGQSASTIVAAYARLLIVEPRKDTPGELHALLLANPLWAPPFFKTVLTDAAHADWLGKAVTANPQLANLTDSIGRRATSTSPTRRASRRCKPPSRLARRQIRLPGRRTRWRRCGPSSRQRVRRRWRQGRRARRRRRAQLAALPIALEHPRGPSFTCLLWSFV